MNGKTKNASAIAPARSSHVQRYEIAEKATSAASGSASRKRRRGRPFAAQHPVREREHRRGEHEVEREQQECLLVAELDGDPERRDGEQRDRDDRGIADERNRAEDDREDSDDDEREPLGLGEEQLEVVVADEGARETGRSEAEEREAGEREEAVAREQHEHGAERPEERGDLGGVRVLHGPATLRVAG